MEPDSAFTQRLLKIRLIQNELNLAIIGAEPYWQTPLWGHEVWHEFQSYLKDGDLLAWEAEIEYGLIPLLLQATDDRWGTVVTALQRLVKAFNLLDPEYVYGCPKCRA